MIITFLKNMFRKKGKLKSTNFCFKLKLFTDGNKYLLVLDDVGLSGSGKTLQEAYDDLMKICEEANSLLGDINLSDIELAGYVAKRETFWNGIRNLLFSVVIVLAIVVVVDAALSPIVNYPTKLRYAILNAGQNFITTDLEKLADKLESIDEDEKDKIIGNIKRIHKELKLISEDISLKKNESNTSNKSGNKNVD